MPITCPKQWLSKNGNTLDNPLTMSLLTHYHTHGIPRAVVWPMIVLISVYFVLIINLIHDNPYHDQKLVHVLIAFWYSSLSWNSVVGYEVGQNVYQWSLIMILSGSESVQVTHNLYTWQTPITCHTNCNPYQHACSTIPKSRLFQPLLTFMNTLIVTEDWINLEN